MNNNNVTMPTTDEMKKYIELLDEASEKYSKFVSLQEKANEINFLSIEDVCSILDCCENTAKKLFNDPEFPCENYGRKKKILVSEFIKFFAVRRDKNKSLYWSN